MARSTKFAAAAQQLVRDAIARQGLELVCLLTVYNGNDSSPLVIKDFTAASDAELTKQLVQDPRDEVITGQKEGVKLKLRMHEEYNEVTYKLTRWLDANVEGCFTVLDLARTSITLAAEAQARGLLDEFVTLTYVYRKPSKPNTYYVEIEF